MFRNHLKIALCNSRKYKAISAMNLLSRTVVLVSYDRHHPLADQTFRLSRSLHTDEGVAIAFPAIAWQAIRAAATIFVKKVCGQMTCEQ
jgi:hypothetical protein